MSEKGLFDFLNSINKSKEDFWESDGANTEELDKTYPAFMVNRFLSYHPDAILYVNELNMRMTKLHLNSLDNYQHFKFLLHALPKKNRFAKLGKQTEDDRISLLMEVLKFSRHKALEVVEFYSEEQYERMRKAFGGQFKK